MHELIPLKQTEQEIATNLNESLSHPINVMRVHVMTNTPQNPPNITHQREGKIAKLPTSNKVSKQKNNPPQKSGPRPVKQKDGG